MEDSFIGTTHGEHNQLTVVGRTGKEQNFKYILKCAVCADDPELYGEGIFYSYKGNLAKGHIPCNCRKAKSFTKEQAKIVLNRKFKDTPISCLSVVDSTTRYKAVMYCSEHEYTWSSSEFRHLKEGLVSCPFCVKDRNKDKLRKSDKEMIESFVKTGAYSPSGVFTRSERLTKAGSKSFWDYHCPICSNDEYVKAGVCSGIFEAFSGSFQTGVIPCRCSKAFYFTKEQREYKVKRILAEEDLDITFVGWKSVYNGGKTKMILNCKEHGDFPREVNAFFSAGTHGCPDCAKYGFKSNKDAVLYVIKTSDFTGYGITNSFETRWDRHWSKLKQASQEIYWCDKFYMMGNEAQRIEKDIKSYFPLHSQNIEGFKTEATYKWLHKDVLNFVVDKIKEYNIDDPRNYDSIGEVL